MKANTQDIQKIYNEIPSRYVVNGNTIDGYDKLTENHFADGWREVIIPDTNELQRLGDEFILVGDIVTKEVIDFTTEEIEAYNLSLIPTQVSRMKFIIQVYITTGIKYEDIVLFIENLAFDESQKYVILTRLRSATHFERNSSDLLTIAAMMGITSEQLDSIFINGNLID